MQPPKSGSYDSNRISIYEGDCGFEVPTCNETKDSSAAILIWDQAGSHTDDWCKNLRASGSVRRPRGGESTKA